VDRRALNSDRSFQVSSSLFGVGPEVDEEVLLEAI
jgi:hypothetical protein